MSRQGRSLFLRRTALYGLFAGILGYSIYFRDFTMASISLEIILIPLLASITIFYVASIVGIAFEGILAEVLAGTLYAAGFASFFALAPSTPQASPPSSPSSSSSNRARASTRRVTSSPPPSG
jgi:hypothetical protein